MSESQHKEKPKTIFLKDYCPPDYRIETVNLQFDLDETRTSVKSLLSSRAATTARGCAATRAGRTGPYAQGRGLDGRSLGGDYRVDPESLTIPSVPEQFTLEIETEIDPRENTSLSGLYMSGSGYTQCEAEGSRRDHLIP